VSCYPLPPEPALGPQSLIAEKPHHPDPVSTRLLPVLTQAPIKSGKAIPASSKRGQMAIQLSNTVKEFARSSIITK
jgi:hypothetical protein